MQSQQIEIHLSDFRINLQHKLAKNISIGCIMFFALFVFIKIVATELELQMRTRSQFGYMVRIGREMVEKEGMQIERAMNFLDGCGKIVEAGGYSAGNNSCDAAFFDCGLSTASNYSTFSGIYPILKANSRSISSNINPTSVFLYSGSQIVYLNSAQLGIGQGSTINSSTFSELISSNPSNSSVNTVLKQKYVLSERPINSSYYHQFFCSQLAPVGSVLCVQLTKKYMGNLLPGLQNLYFQSSDFPQLQSNISTVSLKDWATNASAYDINLLLHHIQSRTTQLSNYIDARIGVPTSCKQPQTVLEGLFTPMFSYAYFHYKISPDIQPTSYKIPLEANPYTITYYISSNSTYANDIKDMISQSCNQIRHTGFSLIAVIALALFVLTISVDTIETTLISSIMLVRNMSEHLRNKEEKQFNSVTKRPQLFAFLIDYFHKFMWIHRLLKFKTKAKYKRLLKEGVDLFGHQNSAVQQYIFRQLIAIEGILVQKYLKMRELPLRRKLTSKSQKQTLSKSKAKMEEAKQKTTSKRRFANYNLLNPDNEDLMKNISTGLRGNRGVRFSNEIQTLQIDGGPILRKSKSSEIYGQTCKTIQNQLSQSNIQSANNTEPKEEEKSQKSYDDSEVSLNGIMRGKKKDSSLLKSRGFQSVHFDLNNLRLDQEFSDEQDDITKEITEEQEIYQMSPTGITDETSQSYRRIITYYEDLIALKSQSLTESSLEVLTDQVGTIYELTLQKYWWWSQLLTFENQMNIIKQEEEREQLAQFEDLNTLEHRYTHLIRHELIQRGQIARLLIHQSLQLPVPFKNLQYLAKSNQKQVRITARYLIATMAEQLNPHLDEVLFQNLVHPLLKEESSNTVIRKLLSTMIHHLQSQKYSAIFEEEVPELKLVRQFYNTNNKKIYFLSSLPNPKPYHKLLSKLYDLIHPFDLLCMFNLDQQSSDPVVQENSEVNLNRVRVRRNQSDKIKFLLDTQEFINIFNFSQRGKENISSQRANSLKTINKKRVYEKEFHEILSCIQSQQTQFSKYIIVLLGDEHGAYTSQGEQTSSSTGNNRPYQQRIHQEITKIIDKGYHHFIMAGHQLAAYPSKYGRLKKYLKLAPDLLEVDLSDKDQEENYRQLEKYLK